MELFKFCLTAFVASVALTGVVFAFEPENAECIAPADAGGGWDFTCRQVSKTLQDLGLIPGTMQVTNLAGGGGGVAFAEVVNERAYDNELIVAASSATATRLAQGAYPGNTMDQVRWIGAIGADYGVIAVANDSPIQSLTELLDAVKEDPAAISFAGGSAVGGWDHLKVLLIAQKAGIEDMHVVKYVPFDGGAEAIAQTIAGSTQAFTGDASEVLGVMKSGDLRAIAVMSPQRLDGQLHDIPTAKEQGIDVMGANWRGFYGPGDMSDQAYEYWVEQIERMYESPEWKTTMKANALEPLDLAGAKFESFVVESISGTMLLSKAIGLID